MSNYRHSYSPPRSDSDRGPVSLTERFFKLPTFDYVHQQQNETTLSPKTVFATSRIEIPSRTPETQEIRRDRYRVSRNTYVYNDPRCGQRRESSQQLINRQRKSRFKSAMENYRSNVGYCRSVVKNLFR